MYITSNKHVPELTTPLYQSVIERIFSNTLHLAYVVDI